MSEQVHAPASEQEAANLIRGAVGTRAPFEIRGGGTRRSLGRPVQAAATLSSAGLSGITLYEPGALTLVARAGARLAEIERQLAAENQQLPFEPMDHRPLLGTEGEPTIGGVVAANVSGPRRIQAGACRDSLIGARFVTGAGEIVKSGGRVMKNVTGLDLAKLSAGAFGTLGFLTEVSFKVLPRPETTACLLVHGLSDQAAIALLSKALGSPYETTGAAHLPREATPEQTAPVTMLRIEGFEGSVRHRLAALAALLGQDLPAGAEIETVEDGAAAAERWAAIRDVRPLAETDGAVWRLSLRPSRAAEAVEKIAAARPIARRFYDWGGGLVWLATAEDEDAGAAAIRGVVGAAGGHATLVRASDALRQAVPPFQPEAPRLAGLAAELRARFDPHRLLNPGRMAA